MGLDTTHGCFQGSYTSFFSFKCDIENQIKIKLKNDYSLTKICELIEINTFLEPLLNHSDCDGELTPQECEKIVVGLNYILNNFNEEILHDERFKERLNSFIKGCELAIKNNESVIFE